MIVDIGSRLVLLNYIFEFDSLFASTLSHLYENIASPAAAKQMKLILT